LEVLGFSLMVRLILLRPVKGVLGVMLVRLELLELLAT
jgi:hypothetical protein